MDQSASDRLRSRFGLETDETKAEKALVERTQRQFDQYSKARRKTEYEWWLNDQFYNGEQYITYNKTIGQMQRNSSSGDKLVINKIKQNARFVIMWLNRDHPRSHVKPGQMDSEAYVNAKKAEHYLDMLYDKLELNRKNKQTSLDAYKYKVGFQKIVWDPETTASTTPFTLSSGAKSSSTKGEVSIERVDPYELYWDPLMTTVEESRGFIHAVPRTLGEIKANSGYKNKEKLTADNKLASSYIKEAQLRFQTSSQTTSPSVMDDSATLIVREHYWREHDVESGWKIRKVVTTNNGVLLKDEWWPMDFYPFEMFLADVQGNPLDGGSPIRDLRSPQRALNQINSIIQTNANIMGKINWRIPRNANVNVITDEVGQFLEFDPTPGGAPEQVQPAGLPAYMPSQRDAMEKYIDDIGGNHSASYGRSPGSKASGELVNRLQEGDSNNLLLMRDNLDDFEKRVFKKALLTFKENAVVDRMVRTKFTNAMGKYGAISLSPDDISIDDDIAVITGNNMPYSQSDRQEFLLNMKKEGVIDNRMFAKLLGNAELDNALNTNLQADMDRAMKENADMMAGQQVAEPIIAEDHQAHMDVHTELIRSPEYLAANSDVQATIMAHYGAHVDMSIQLAKRAASMNIEPLKRSISMMVRPNNPNEFTPIERENTLGLVGVTSDAGLIQARGGLEVQDPAQAEQQAQLEDTQMLDDIPMPISYGDNHQVHIETHSQVLESAAAEHLSDVTKKIINKHIHDHLQALQSQNTTKGLAVTPDTTIQHVSMAAKKPNPVAAAAMNPEDPTPRPLMPHELLQHSKAVAHQRASETMAVRQDQAKKADKEAAKKKEKPAKA